MIVLPQKYWHLMGAYLFTQPACLVSLPALFMPATFALVFLSLFIMSWNALSNIFFLDIYGLIQLDFYNLA
jgi:hypothetical protein